MGSRPGYRVGGIASFALGLVAIAAAIWETGQAPDSDEWLFLAFVAVFGIYFVIQGTALLVMSRDRDPPGVRSSSPRAVHPSSVPPHAHEKPWYPHSDPGKVAPDSEPGLPTPHPAKGPEQ